MKLLLCVALCATACSLMAKDWTNVPPSMAAQVQIQLLTAEIRENPHLNPAYLERGITYARSGKTDLGIADLTHYLNAGGTNGQAYYVRGLLYATNRQWSSASDDLRRARELDPNDHKARNWLAYTEREASIQWATRVALALCCLLVIPLALLLCSKLGGRKAPASTIGSGAARNCAPAGIRVTLADRGRLTKCPPPAVGTGSGRLIPVPSQRGRPL
jgi:tetratricopeptide (TPR) repeat protein